MADLARCGTHGEVEARYVCEHIHSNEKSAAPKRMIYFEPHHESSEPVPAIWCAACETVVVAQGEINEVVEAFARFHTVCEFCFQKYLERNAPAEAG